MNFLKSAIQEEISKKRKVLESIEKKGEGENKKQKYKKARLEAEEAKRKDLERQQAKANEKENQEKSEEETETFNIPMEECIRRLRAMGQPIRLFAETDKQCKLRLRALELMDEQQSE
ncbi:hypothetical protein G6F38_008899 [Rhizopus arrhizus]|nr:hypothetical protein G6F38_008899 [Rhizopus arrhizus]